jgi:hypothetical protein
MTSPSRADRNKSTRGIKTVLVDEAHETRASELVANGLKQRAERVLTCGVQKRGALKCKQRACPTCASDTAKKNALRATVRSARFARPCFITLTTAPRGIYALAEGLNAFRAALFSWRRKAVVKRGLKGAVGGLEPKYSAPTYAAGSLPCWLVHAHFIVDARPGIDFEALGRAWEDSTGGGGELLVPPKLGVDVHDVEKAAAYLSKHADWSPRPGTLPEAMVGQLFQNLHRRQLLMRWGTGRPKRCPAP